MGLKKQRALLPLLVVIPVLDRVSLHLPQHDLHPHDARGDGGDGEAKASVGDANDAGVGAHAGAPTCRSSIACVSCPVDGGR